MTYVPQRRALEKGVLVALAVWGAGLAGGCYPSVADEPATDTAVDRVVAVESDVRTSDGFPESEGAEDGTASADDFTEVSGDLDAEADGEAVCRWSGEYVRATDGACWMARDGSLVEPVVEECCYYRLCNYACGPCFAIDECPAERQERTYWCLCSTPGPPSPEVDSRTCDDSWLLSPYHVVLWVEPAAEAVRAELDGIAAKYCARLGIRHHTLEPLDVVSFDFWNDVGWFAGPCPWQVAAEVGELLIVREVIVDWDSAFYLYDACCEEPWDPDCHLTPG